jgi:TonB-linked SusC/RagA family outer membrane protein
MKKNIYTKKFTAVFKIVALQALFFLLLSTFANAKPLITTVKGKITDATTNEAITGVTVRIKGTNTAVFTNAAGEYSIAATSGNVLTFSFIGYQTKDVPVTNNDVIDVKLDVATNELQDVVVTALGIKKESRSVGYSVTQVKGATLTEARTNSFVNGLEGKIAGVNVSNVSTGPNGSTNVVIRGISSVKGSNQPLYVVDGVILNNNNYRATDNEGYGGADGGDGIGDINPDDIETISVQKGAAATALYGYRGANGVIIITTKKGKNKDGIVEVNSNYVIEKVVDETDFQQQYGEGDEGVAPKTTADAQSSGESSWGAPLNGQLVPQFDGVSRPYSAVSKGNLNRFYQEGGAATNSVAFSKAFGDNGEDATRFSVSDLQDNSIVPNAGLQRMTFSQTTQYKLAKRLSLDLSTDYISEYTKNRPNVSDAPGNLNWGAEFEPPNINITTLSGNSPKGPGTYANGNELLPWIDAYTTNPYFAAYQFINDTRRNRFIGSSDLKYTFDDGYYLDAKVADDYSSDRNTIVTPNGTAYQYQGSMLDETIKQTELNIDVTGGKVFKFNKDFSLTSLIGVNYRKNVTEYVDASGSTFNVPGLYNIANLAVLSDGYQNLQIENESIYASADLAYKNYLYLDFTGRNDWYSTLAPGAKINYLYPSVAASFVFSELLHIPNMDMGKLRLSYADVGGEADSPYGTLLTYNTITTYNANGLSYPLGGIATGGQVPNSGLRPSSEKEYEIGTEMDFFKNRLTFDIAFYQKKITNSVIPATVDEASGYTSALLNLGDLRNNGVELEIGGTPIKGDKFSWNIDFNGTYNDNQILSLGAINNTLLANSRAGEDDGQGAYITQVVGKAADQIYALDPPKYPSGAYKKSAQTGLPLFQSATYRAFGSGIDPWAAGITNTFKYGHFDFSFQVDSKFGGKIFSGTNWEAYTDGLSKATLPNRLGGFGLTNLPAEDYYGRMAIEQQQFVYDASFIKLRQVIFGYDFPTSLFHDKIRSLRLSFVARNLWTIMKHTPNVDPESGLAAEYSGLELADVPYTRTLGFNLKMTF